MESCDISCRPIYQYLKAEIAKMDKRDRAGLADMEIERWGWIDREANRYID